MELAPAGASRNGGIGALYALSLNRPLTLCQYRPKTGSGGHDSVTEWRDASAL